MANYKIITEFDTWKAETEQGRKTTIKTYEHNLAVSGENAQIYTEQTITKQFVTKKFINVNICEGIVVSNDTILVMISIEQRNPDTGIGHWRIQ